MSILKNNGFWFFIIIATTLTSILVLLYFTLASIINDNDFPFRTFYFYRATMKSEPSQERHDEKPTNRFRPATLIGHPFPTVAIAMVEEQARKRHKIHSGRANDGPIDRKESDNSIVCPACVSLRDVLPGSSKGKQYPSQRRIPLSSSTTTIILSENHMLRQLLGLCNTDSQTVVSNAFVDADGKAVVLAQTSLLRRPPWTTITDLKPHLFSWYNYRNNEIWHCFYQMNIA